MNRLDQHQPLTSTVTIFYEGDSIAQIFPSNRNDLNTVSICIRNPARALTPMTFTLTEGDKVIRTIEFSGGNIDNEDCTKFKFDKIPDSQNKTYVATISLRPGDKNIGIPPVFNVEMHEGVMHYKTFYYQSVKDTVAESLAQLPPRILSDWTFFIIWGSLIGLILSRLLKRNGK